MTHELQIPTPPSTDAASFASLSITLNGHLASVDLPLAAAGRLLFRAGLCLCRLSLPDLGDIQSIRLRHPDAAHAALPDYILVRRLSDARAWLTPIPACPASGGGGTGGAGGAGGAAGAAGATLDLTVPAHVQCPSEVVQHPFDRAMYGFHFPNSFQPPIPGLPQRWGFCGGMSAGTLHRYRNRTAAPSDRIPPARSSPLYRELLGRQLRTLGPGILARMALMQACPDAASRWRPRTIGHYTREACFSGLIPALRRSPTLIFLILAGRLQSPTRNHQVLGIGYQWFADTSDLVLTAYDPCEPDLVHLFFHFAPSGEILGRYPTGRPIRGFFWNDRSESAAGEWRIPTPPPAPRP